eukprot:1046876-Amorphochlora_amoeboformis.AAC.2
MFSEVTPPGPNPVEKKKTPLNDESLPSKQPQTPPAVVGAKKGEIRRQSDSINVQVEPAPEPEEKPKENIAPHKGRRYSGNREPRGPPELPSGPPFKAFVGRLPYQTEEVDIADIFQDCQIHAVRLVRDKSTAQFKGFGYVEFSSLEDLKHALELNDTEYRGRRIRVDVAQERNEGRKPRGRGGRGGRGSSRGRGNRRRGGRSGFRNSRPERMESPIRQQDKVNPFGAARPREAVLAERKKREKENAERQEATKGEKAAASDQRRNEGARGHRGRGWGRRGRGRGYRGRGHRGRGYRGRGRRGRGRTVGANEGRRERRKSTNKSEEAPKKGKDPPYVPEFKKKPLKKVD